MIIPLSKCSYEAFLYRIDSLGSWSTCQILDKSWSKGLDDRMSQSANTTDLDQYLKVALTACDGASVILNNHFGNLRNLDEKFQAGLVSDADRESEKFICDHIRKFFPDHSILGEESGLSVSEIDSKRDKSSSQNALWMVDPLDGTTNFVHQFPFFCISIGLELNGELVVGVVDAPKLGMRFHAVKGGGAFLNGESIHVSPRSQFRDGLFATGFSSYDNELDQQLEIVSVTIKEARGIRRAGAAALDLCFVAQGAYDAFWERNLQPWDTAAGVVIAREAGASVSDMQGNAYNPRLRSILCGSPFGHSEMLSRMKRIRASHGH